MTDWLYNEAMYRFDQAQPSHWEATIGAQELAAPPLQSSEQCDVAIIGGGYTGLSAAYHLCRDYQLDVRLLEAGHIGWGASGRNGGFCSIGGEALGAERMVQKYGVANARAYYAGQVDAVGLVRDLLTDEHIDAECQGDREISVAVSAKGFERLKEHAEFQFRVLGLDCGIVSPSEFRDRYFDSPLQHGGAFLRPTFGLHPLRFLLGLGAAAERHGVKLHGLSEVIDWSGSAGAHVLTTKAGVVRAKRVIVATNGYFPEHLHPQFRARVLPMISSILVTRPMSAEEIALQRWQTDCPSITSVSLLNYFRLLPDGRFMFGGRGSADGSEVGAQHNYRELHQRMVEVFPRWRDVDIDYRWHGLVCMTRRLTPAIGHLDDDPSVYFGFGYHGNGVNTATWCGKKLAEWVGESRGVVPKAPKFLPDIVRGLPARFPLAGMRLSYVQAVIGLRRLLQKLRN